MKNFSGNNKINFYKKICQKQTYTYIMTRFSFFNQMIYCKYVIEITQMRLHMVYTQRLIKINVLIHDNSPENFCIRKLQMRKAHSQKSFLRKVFQRCVPFTFTWSETLWNVPLKFHSKTRSWKRRIVCVHVSS